MKMVEKINKEQMDKEMQSGSEKNFKDTSSVFGVQNDEIETALSGGFNPAFNTKSMEYNKPIKFKCLSRKPELIETNDKFAKEDGAKKVTPVVTIENLFDKNIYSLWLSARTLRDAFIRLYVDSNNNLENEYFSLVKIHYNHPKWGDTDGFRVNKISVDEFGKVGEND